MRSLASLPAKLGAIGSLLLVLALAAIGLTLWLSWRLEGGAAAANEAGRMRMQTWRLAQTITASDQERLHSQQAQFDSSWTKLLNSFQFQMMGIVSASAVTPLYATHLLVLNALARLRAGLARVSAGDLSARVPVETADEFGALATGFNEMAHALQGLNQALEARVQEKTLSPQAERARLSALYEAAAFVATASSIEELAQGFARQVRQVARADASALRWSGENDQRYLLLASDCLPQEVVDAERCLPTGDCFCGQVQGRAQTRVIPIRAGEGGSLLGHCDCAGRIGATVEVDSVAGAGICVVMTLPQPQASAA